MYDIATIRRHCESLIATALINSEIKHRDETGTQEASQLLENV